MKMKRVLIVLMIGALSLSLAACGSGANASSNAAKETAVAAENLQTANFKVIGMTCGSCTFIVESAISELDGISQVKAEFPDKATVTFDPSKVSLDQIKQAVIDVGYGVE
jgi:copper chaperone CopZ